MYCLPFHIYITFNQLYTVYPHLQYIYIFLHFFVLQKDMFVLRNFQVKALEKKKWTSQLSVNQPEPGPQISLEWVGMVLEPGEP